MKKRIIFYHFLFLFLCSTRVLASDTTLIQSPDGTVHFKIFQQMNHLSYTITFNGNTVIKPSPFLMTVDGISVTQNVAIAKTERYKINETYQWRGVHSKAINHCNGAKIFTNNKQKCTLEVHVFNNGAAFRIIIPGKQNQSRIPGETTVFNIPSKSTIWYHDLNMHYESVHVKKQIDDVEQGEWVAPPATYKLPRGNLCKYHRSRFG